MAVSRALRRLLRIRIFKRNRAGWFWSPRWASCIVWRTHDATFVRDRRA